MPDRPVARSSLPAELLRTKLAPPRLPAALVPRPALISRLEAGLARKLTLVVAPAGFGKSTLVAQWLAARGGPAAWLSLEPADDDPVRFWSYCLTACRSFQPALGKASLSALRAAQPAALEAVLTPFLNELAHLAAQRLLVLEDYHTLTAPAIHASLAFLLDHLPPALHLVLITRSLPPLPLARWRARAELSELTAAELRFSPDETRAFVEQVVGRALSSEILARLEARTEGWVAGLRLMALGVQGQTEPRAAESILASFSGGHRHVLEYLASEVLAAQPEAVQQFLLETSGLSRLNASLSEAVTGRADSAQVLERLERDNVFLVPLAGQWYRYHTLFAEAMREQARATLGEAGLAAAQARASRWYEARGLLAEAVGAALAAREFERAAALAERAIELRGQNGGLTLQRWVEQLPPAVLYAHPSLCFGYAFVMLFTSDRRSPGTPALLEGPLRAAEELWRGARNAAGLGQVLGLRAMVSGWQDDLPRALALAAQALELLPESDVFWRGISLLYVGMAERLSGQLNGAQRLLLEARALCEAAQNAYAAQAATLQLGNLAIQQGDFDQATQYAELVLAHAAGQADMLDGEGQAALVLAWVAYERDDLPAAERHATRAAEVGRLSGDEEMQAEAELLLARSSAAHGQLAAAQQRLQALSARLRHPGPLRVVQTGQARLWLAAGDLASAERWAASLEAIGSPGAPASPEAAASPDSPSVVQQEREALVLARLRLGQGQGPAALELLEAWRADAHAQGRARSELEILLLEALAQSTRRGVRPRSVPLGLNAPETDDASPEAAAATLTRALALAQPSGYRRLFLDEGQPIGALLQAVLPGLTRRPLAAYAAGLLRAFAPHASPLAARQPSPLFEPLSPQEQRVLRLLVAGLSNAAIARELVVSPNTVKTQLKSIYRKLDVTSRDEAREAAQELNLL